MKHIRHVRLDELRPEGGKISIFEVFVRLRPIDAVGGIRLLGIGTWGNAFPVAAATGKAL